MRSFEIFVDQKLQTAAAPLDVAPRSGLRSKARGEVLDVFVHGANVTATIAEGRGGFVLRDIALAIGELARAPRGKRIVHFYDDAWAFAIERLGAVALLSVYRSSPVPEVLLYDAELPFAEVLAGVAEATERALARGDDPELALARQALELTTTEDVERPSALPTFVEIDKDSPIALGCEFSMRPGPDASADTGVERSDLHALLFRGRIFAEVRGRSVELGDGHPFLVAERFLDLARAAFDAWDSGQLYHVRADAAGVPIGLRVGPDGQCALAVTQARKLGAARTTATFPALDVCDVAEAAIAFARGLVRVIQRRDRTQHQNLRLGALRQRARELGEAIRDVRRTDSKINPSPESYRAFALRRPAPAAEAPASPVPTRLRYRPRWRALVPGIDLRATFLCGDRLIVGGVAETFCLDRTTGELLWQARTERATAVVTPGGLARIKPDGAVEVHDFGNGEVTLRTWIAPRTSGPYAGAVVSAPGLPRLLVVTEGDQHLAAIDLMTGEARWRYAWGRRGVLRLKRAGKLLYVSSGDSGLTALDVTTGAVVWRARDRRRFRAAPAVDASQLFAVLGGVGSPASLVCLDPYSGEPSWRADIDAGTGALACSIEGTPLVTERAVVVLVRERHTLRVVGYDRATGARLFASACPEAPVGTSWLVVDDLLVGNTPAGALVAVSAETGALRYKHALGSGLEADLPRRLEPVLRSGALYVPHAEVHVFRPSDGTRIATIGPSEAIPDLLRVDENNNVYVAEESGHVVSYGVGPRLELVGAS